MDASTTQRAGRNWRMKWKADADRLDAATRRAEHEAASRAAEARRHLESLMWDYKPGALARLARYLTR